MIINQGFEPEDNNESSKDWQARLEPTIPKEISYVQFIELLKAGRIVDGRAGGLVLGKTSDDGPSRLIFKLGTTYVLEGFVTGGSFILTKEASLRNRNRIKKMNAGLTLRETVEDEPGDGVGQFICCAGFPHSRLVWIDLCQDIVGPEAAGKHMIELAALNMALNPYLSNDSYEIFGRLTAAKNEEV